MLVRDFVSTKKNQKIRKNLERVFFKELKNSEKVDCTNLPEMTSTTYLHERFNRIFSQIEQCSAARRPAIHRHRSVYQKQNDRHDELACETQICCLILLRFRLFE